MYVSVPKEVISTMQGFHLVLNVGFQRHMHQGFQTILVLNVCQCHPKYYYSMYVSIPKAPISTMQGFQTILVLNVCQCSKGSHLYHALVNMQGFQTILVLNVCQALISSKGNNIIHS